MAVRGFTETRKPSSVDHPVRLFGISIAENIQWITTSVPNSSQPIKTFSLGELEPVSDYAAMRDEEVDIEARLDKILSGLDEGFRKEVRGVGVSSIGVIDRARNAHAGLSRKRWIEHDDKGVFNANIFHLYFPNVEKDRVIIQNDATAAALAEARYFPEKDRPRFLFYLTVNEGINGSYINSDREQSSLSHPELGHIFGQLHEIDRDVVLSDAFRSQSGCPEHVTCFEGVASGRRIMESWNGTLQSLGPQSIAWEVVSFYIAQMCLIGLYTLAPEYIVIGGSQIDELLEPDLFLEMIRNHFYEKLGNYPLKRVIPHLMTTDYIRPSAFKRNAQLVGALELARDAAFRVNPVSPLQAVKY